MIMQYGECMKVDHVFGLESVTLSQLPIFNVRALRTAWMFLSINILLYEFRLDLDVWMCIHFDMSKLVMSTNAFVAARNPNVL